MAEAQQAHPRNVDIIAAMVGIAGGIAISLLNFIYTNEYLITMGPILAITCLGYIIFRRKLLRESPPPPEAGTSFILTINILFWLSLAGSIYSLGLETLHRPLIYFLLTSFSAAMTALQILFCREKTTIWLVLFEILVLSLSVRASAFWVFPTIPGIDSWWHMTLVEDYVTQGQIFQYVRATGGDNYYYSTPIMHLNVANTQILTQVDYKTAMFFGAGLPLLLSTVLVFLIGQRLSNTKVGLLATLLLNLSDYHIGWGAENIIAMSIGLTLFTMILYLLTCKGGQADRFMMALAILFLVILVFTHSISSFIMLTWIITATLGMYAYKFLYHHYAQRERNMLSFMLLTLFVAVWITHSIYLFMVREGLSFFDAMIKGFYQSITEKAQLLITRAPAATTEWGLLGPIANISGYLILLFFGIVGCLIWLSYKNRGKTKLGLIVALIVMIGLPLSFPLFGIADIQPTRWPAFYYTILSIAAAEAILGVSIMVTSKSIRNVVFSSLMFVYFFVMITNSVANTDSPIYAAYLSERQVYTESEIAARNIVMEYDGQIIADLRYGAVLTLLSQGIKTTSNAMLNESLVNRSLVIWRDIFTERPAAIFTPGKGRHLEVLGESYEQKLEDSHNLIYSNKDTKVFMPKNLP